MALAHFTDIAWDNLGRPLSEATVEVFEPGTTTLIAGPIYSDRAGTITLPNPFVVQEDGEVEFYLSVPSIVDVRYSKDLFITETHDVDVMSADSFPALVNGVIPIGYLPDLAALDAEITAAVSAEAALREAADAAEVIARNVAIAALVDSSPSVLDTLNELAQALGDDPNFSATITALIGTKAVDSTVVHLAGAETITAAKTFQAPDAASVPITIKGFAGQTGFLMQWQDSAGSPVAIVAPDGTSAWLGSMSVSKGIQMGGYQSPSGIPLVVGGASGQTGDLTRWIDFSAATIINITAAGVFNSLANIVTTKRIQAGGSSAIAGALTAIPLSVSEVGLVVRGMASQTGDLQQWQNSAGAVLGSLAADGSLSLGNSAQSWATRLTVSSRGVFAALSALRGDTLGGADFAYGDHSLHPFCHKIQGAAATPSNAKPVVLRIDANRPVETPLYLRGAASQTADLQQWQDSAGNPMAAIKSGGIFDVADVTLRNSGALRFAGFWHMSGNGTSVGFTRTGVQDVAWWGGSAAVAAAVVRGYAAQVGNLQEWQDSAGVTRFAILPSGRGFLGQSETASLAKMRFNSYYGDAGGNLTYWSYNTQLAGTWVQDTVAHSSIAMIIGKYSSMSDAVIQFSSQVAGATALTPVLAVQGNNGQIKIGGPWIDADMGTDLGAQVHLRIPLAARVGLVIKGAASQSVDLQMWQNSAAGIVARVTNIGGMEVTGSLTGLATALTIASPNGYLYLNPASASAIYLGTDADTAEVAVRRRMILTRNAPADVGLIVKGAAAQTADLQQWQDSTGAVIFGVTAAGIPKWRGSNAQTTVGAAGAASALPATPSRYLKVIGEDGLTYVVPAYLAA